MPQDYDLKQVRELILKKLGPTKLTTMVKGKDNVMVYKQSKGFDVPLNVFLH